MAYFSLYDLTVTCLTAHATDGVIEPQILAEPLPLGFGELLLGETWFLITDSLDQLRSLLGHTTVPAYSCGLALQAQKGYHSEDSTRAGPFSNVIAFQLEGE